MHNRTREKLSADHDHSFTQRKQHNKYMNFDNFTIKAQEAVQHAVQTAQRTHRQAITAPHLLQGVIAV